MRFDFYLIFIFFDSNFFPSFCHRVFIFFVSVFFFKVYFEVAELRESPAYKLKCNIISRPLDVKTNFSSHVWSLNWLNSCMDVWVCARESSHLVIVCSENDAIAASYQLNAIIAVVMYGHITISHDQRHSHRHPASALSYSTVAHAIHLPNHKKHLR